MFDAKNCDASFLFIGQFLPYTPIILYFSLVFPYKQSRKRVSLQIFCHPVHVEALIGWQLSLYWVHIHGARFCNGAFCVTRPAAHLLGQVLHWDSEANVENFRRAYRSIEISVTFKNIADISSIIDIFTDFSENFPIFPTSPARAQDIKSVQFF